MEGWNEILLDRVKHAAIGRVSREALASATTAEAMFDYFTDQLVVRLMSEVLSNWSGQLVVEYPATWWDHLKAAKAPAWFKRRHPVRMHYEVRSVRTTYPEAVLTLPELGPVRFVQYNTPAWKE